MLLIERASRSMAVALPSSNKEVSGDVKDVIEVGEREGGWCTLRESVPLGVTGVLVPDVGRRGSLESTEVRG